MQTEQNSGWYLLKKIFSPKSRYAIFGPWPKIQLFCRTSIIIIFENIEFCCLYKQKILFHFQPTDLLNNVFCVEADFS